MKIGIEKRRQPLKIIVMNSRVENSSI